MPELGLSGGDRLTDRLRAIAARLGEPQSVRVGFLENATYPDGLSVAYVAAINEFGGTWTVPPRQVTIYRAIDAAGDFKFGGRFVKRSKSNFASDHAVPEHQHVQPPRPFFRNMIAKCGPEWGNDIAKILPAADYDVRVTLGRMGERIVGQLRQSIQDTNTPPLAPSTIRRKGFTKPLIFYGVMYQSADYQVVSQTEVATA